MDNIYSVSGDKVPNLNTERKAENIKSQERRSGIAQSSSRLSSNQDVVSISSQGMVAAGKAADLKKYAEMIKALPDVDQAKIDAVSRKVKDGVYFTKEAAELTAKKIVEAAQQYGE